MVEIKKNKHDYFVIALSLILIVFITIHTMFKYNDDAKIVNVYYHDEVVYTMNLDVDEIFVMKKEKYKDLQADLTVEIKNKKVRIAEEKSKNHICSLQGWEDRAGRPLVCLPNYVMVIIEGYEITDTDMEM